MKFSTIKLKAQERLAGHHFKSLAFSLLPYISIILLFLCNYYLFIFLKNATLTTFYDVYIKASLFTVSIVISFVLQRIFSLVSKSYIYRNTVKIKPKQLLNGVTVTILKFFLSVAWTGFLYAPSTVMGATLYYSIKFTDYTFSILLTLFVATVMLFIMGTVFSYVILKRYALCDYIVLNGKNTDAVKIIEESSNTLEGNTVKYALYSLSFVGWTVSCIFIVPIFYALPYFKTARGVFFDSISKKEPSKKPVIIYLTGKTKVVGNVTSPTT